jgi:[acyl-carrier-protein] S-malonyltransferase
MRRAAPADPGAMTAVLGAGFAAIEEAAAAAAEETSGVCVVANDNAPGQVVLSGTTEAIERAEVLAKEAGAKRAVRLGVSAGFHSPLMAPAAEEMAEVLEAVALQTPVPPVVANVTAAPVLDPDEIRGLLVRQITGRVRWRESIAYLASEGVDAVAEVGAGKVLSGLARRIEPELTAVSIETPDDVDAFLSSR